MWEIQNCLKKEVLQSTCNSSLQRSAPWTADGRWPPFHSAAVLSWLRVWSTACGCAILTCSYWLTHKFFPTCHSDNNVMLNSLIHIFAKYAIHSCFVETTFILPLPFFLLKFIWTHFYYWNFATTQSADNSIKNL